jgi:hypothetical protein
LTESFISGLGGNPLGVTANGDSDPFPGTIWVATFNANIVVLEPQDFVNCIPPGDPAYDPLGDNDSDGYSNDDEEQNGSDPCNGGSLPGDFDRLAGAPLVSDLNDVDDDADGTNDDVDALQLGDPLDAGSDAFPLPVVNELFSDNPLLGGYLGLGFTGLMNNGDPNPNWLDWLDQTDAGPNPNDILGGAVGAMTMQMTPGTAVGSSNNQEKAFQYGAIVDLATGGFRIESRMLNFDAGLQLYPFAGDGELGIFMGDGSQSNFIRFVVSHDGVEVLQELDDVPQTPLSTTIAVADRPTASLTFRLDVDSATGAVSPFYAIDDGPFESVGDGSPLMAGGAILTAIQQTDVPLSVGLIGSSNTAGAEVEGTWDYLNVVGRQPSVAAPIPDVEESIGGAATLDLDLDAYFDDDDGVAGLAYSIVSETDPAIGAEISGSTLTLTFPAFVAASTLTVRATDGSGLFIEQSFSVIVTDPPSVAIYRVNAGGPLVTAIDDGIDWEEDTAANNSSQLADPGSNDTAGFTMSGYTPEVDLATTPTGIYQTERWDNGSGPPRITYSFPVDSPGTYEARLYMGNGWSGANDPGERVFSVEIEGVAHADLTNLDLTATFGHTTGGVVSHGVDVTDGSLDIEFFHGSANNPMLNGIEILGGGSGPPGGVPITIAPISDQASVEGETIALPVLASGGDTPGSFVYGATGLPTGLQIEPTTGLVFGDVATGAAASSPFDVTIYVDDNDADAGDVVSTGFLWSVSDGTTIPWIDKAEDESYTARHECSFVQAGDRFYLFGGRENAQTLDTYDFAANSWSTSASAPIPFNHFQATEHEGLVWVIGAFETNSFPNEDPADQVWAFDPANDLWMQGPEIPEARRRGSAGLVVYDGKFYVVGGNQLGHNGQYVPFLDEFDPETGVWTPLPDAPRARDHFHAAVVGDELFVVGGRLSGGDGGTFAPLIPEVDVYDFTSGSWSTLTNDLPTPRAASAVGVFGGKILVIGGEGNGQAYATTEALDPTTGTWEALASLNHARHGTQAIVSGEGVYVAAGSPNQGGGNQKNMEVYNADLPTGTPSVAGVLSTPATAWVVGGEQVPVLLDHAGGNQGVYVTSIALAGADAADFAITSAPAGAFLVPLDGGAWLEVEYLGAAANASASLDITHSGGQVASVSLMGLPVPEPGMAVGLTAGVIGLAGLARRHRRRRLPHA